MDDKALNQLVCSQALDEVRRPKFAVTEQFFAVHRLSNAPLAGVWTGDGIKEVYLRLNNVRYYWVVKFFNTKNTYKIVAVYPSAHANVNFSIFSTTFKPKEISGILGLKCSKSWEIGSLYASGRKQHTNHAWFYNSQMPDYVDLERKLESILSDLPSQCMHMLRADCDLILHVGYYEYQGWPGGWHLSASVLRMLADVGCEFNVDLYVDGRDMSPE
jgi:hypothetical protein